MTLNVLKLHIRKVHRISLVDDFVCPKCTQPVFAPATNDDSVDAEVEANESIVDRNLMNQGYIPFRKSLKWKSSPKQMLAIDLIRG